jgi:hypothetical protein
MRDKPRLPGMTFKMQVKPLPFANLAPSSDTKQSLRTLTEESLRTSKLLTSQLATSVDMQSYPEVQQRKFKLAAKNNNLLNT